uniref:Uncharacterized protein n=1 Tax=Anguilla anguilla TaxID=7936 RepID=A0A0E9VYQ3_ANGAN
MREGKRLGELCF